MITWRLLLQVRTGFQAFRLPFCGFTIILSHCRWPLDFYRVSSFLAPETVVPKGAFNHTFEAYDWPPPLRGTTIKGVR
ncbi:Protein TOS1 [Fusarium oxysporum f. sp. albedinis]|nr:Protein TOS1 [Fusarium oxysporum f. sp. albedinis]